MNNLWTFEVLLLTLQVHLLGMCTSGQYLLVRHVEVWVGTCGGLTVIE
ncbi:hypothetical protein M758_7G133300 [Ceratodon purpureus]|uniref:Uncharacterized protein n=1 Tax=Ceratodon purpureus TaxID=3225 RepID=A0A8T0H8K6_CERPU|nr:hypothetical protein KC19_7G144300 [Ceratodon purpureus]KAG0611336.1 hypothetical protein M758_7G133300 [Ceratodon purpureus]